MMKSFVAFLGLVTSLVAGAQLTNTGLPIGITSGTIVSGGGLNSQGSVLNEGSLVLSGEVTVSGGYSGGGELRLTGTDQGINLGPGLTDVGQLTIEGGGEKSLFSPVAITNNLTLTSGKVTVIGSNLNINQGATITGGDASNYVVGKLIRGGTGDLTYPIGTSTQYAPVTLRGIAGTDPEVGVELINSNPNGQIGNGIVDLSENRFWVITAEGGTYDGAQVEIPTLNESIVADLSEGVVAGSSDGVTYRSFGQSAFSGDVVSGSLTSQQPFTTGRVAVGKFFDEQLRINDSTALVSIYNQTGGTDWLTSTGWTTQDLDSWHGITMTEKRVSQVDLTSNNLEGSIPAITTGLENTTTLTLNDNELSEINTLSSLTSLQTLNVQANRLQFGTLETLLAAPFTTDYANQKEVLDRQRVLEQVGNTYTVDRTVTGTANTYSWFNGTEAISQTTPTFEVAITDFTTEGDFYAEVTNPNVPNLTLRTTPILLRVSSLQRDSTALRAIYDQMGGAGWVRGADWPSLPIAQWNNNGVTISNNRVTAIDLESNNLTGALPEDIVDIEGLTSIDLSGNAITTLPNLTPLSSATTLDVSDNQLDFGDLEASATVLTAYAPQAKIGTVFTTQLDKGTDFPMTFEVGGEANDYVWKHNGTDIPNTNTNTYTIEEISFENMGIHTMEVTNQNLPLLTMESEAQTIWAQADIDFTPIYENRLGDPAQLDEGEAWLFKINDPGVPYDTIESPQTIGTSGISFQDIILGDYLMFVRTDTLLLRTVEGETDSVKLLPTYFESTIDWAEADTLQLRDFVDDSLFMQQQPRPLTEDDGDGVITMVVESDFLDETGGRLEARRRVKKAGCSLRRRTTGGGGRPDQEEVFELIAYKETDDNGEVSFGFLPTGLYRLNIQYPGIPMNPDSFVEFEIGEEEENDGFELAATVTEEGITVEVVEELGFYRKYFKDLSVYPVPADERVSIKYGKLMSEDVQLKLVDLRGETIRRQKLERGFNRQLELDVSEVEGGVYLLYFYDEKNSNRNIVFYKVIIRHQF